MRARECVTAESRIQIYLVFEAAMGKLSYISFLGLDVCYRTHTLWNRPEGEIRPLILWGLAGGFFEAF